MRVSIVVPTLNAEKHIVELILSLKQQTLAPAEIVVVDSSSTDHTTDLASELGCTVVMIERKDFDHGGTRNLGVDASSGEIVVLMTQDALPVNDRFLERLVDPLVNAGNIAASFGRQIAKDNANPLEKFARLFNYPSHTIIKARDDIPVLGIKAFFFSDVCSAVKREAFEAVGKFPRKTITNEDMILAAKLILSGHKIAYVPEAEVWHSHNYNLLQQFRRYFDIGAFFRTNDWITEHASAEGEGLRFMKEQLSYLLHKGQYGWIPHALVFAGAKYAGYKLGLLEDKLPIKIKARLSLNRYFWQ